MRRRHAAALLEGEVAVSRMVALHQIQLQCLKDSFAAYASVFHENGALLQELAAMHMHLVRAARAVPR